MVYDQYRLVMVVFQRHNKLKDSRRIMAKAPNKLTCKKVLECLLHLVKAQNPNITKRVERLYDLRTNILREVVKSNKKRQTAFPLFYVMGDLVIMGLEGQLLRSTPLLLTTLVILQW